MDKFTEAAQKERFAFTQLCKKYNMFTEDQGYAIYLTPDEGYDKYDALIQHYNEDTYICDKRYITEFKIRQVAGSTLEECRELGWILEQKKFNSLMSVSNLDPDKNQVLYISFVNDKTLIWNLTLLENKNMLHWEKKEMNKATMESRDNKIYKKVCLLKEDWAKVYKYVYDDKSYYANIDEVKKLQQIRKNDTKSMGNTLTDLLFGKNNKY